MRIFKTSIEHYGHHTQGEDDLFRSAYLDQEIGIIGFHNKSSQLWLLKSRFGIYSTIFNIFRNHFASVIFVTSSIINIKYLLFTCSIVDS